MALGKLGALGRGFGRLGVLGGAGPASYAPYPAPAGYRWEFLTENGQVLTESGQPLVDLVKG